MRLRDKLKIYLCYHNITFLEGFLPITPHKIWSCCIGRSRGKLKPSYLHYHIASGHQPWQDGDLSLAVPTHTYSSIWSRGLARSRDKLNTSYLPYHNTYGHQTWQGPDTQWGAFTHKATWSFNHVVLWGTWQIKFFNSPLAINQWSPILAMS